MQLATRLNPPQKVKSIHFFVYRRSFVILQSQLYNVIQCTEILLAVNFG